MLIVIFGKVKKNVETQYFASLYIKRISNILSINHAETQNFASLHIILRLCISIKITKFSV